MSLRVGLVGVGRWGRNIARTIREEVPGVTLAAAATSNPAARDIVGPGCALHPDWRAMLRAEKLDGVLLATPARLHAEIASAVMTAGLPVFVEKPVALSVAEAARLLEQGRAEGAIALVDHIDLFNPALIEMRRRADGKGRDFFGRIGAAYDRRDDITPLWEYSPHFIAAAMEIYGGAPSHVSAERLPRESAPKDDPSKEIVRLTLRFADGRRAVIEAGNGMIDKTRRIDLATPDATLHYVDRAEVPLAIARGGVRTPIAVDETKPLTGSIRHFEALIRRGEPDVAGLATGLAVIRVLDAADRALALEEEASL